MHILCVICSKTAILSHTEGKTLSRKVIGFCEIIRMGISPAINPHSEICRWEFLSLLTSTVCKQILYFWITSNKLFKKVSQQLHRNSSDVCNVICRFSISNSLLGHLQLEEELLNGEKSHIASEMVSVSTRQPSWQITAWQQLSEKNRETNTEPFSHVGSPGTWQREGVFRTKWWAVS